MMRRAEVVCRWLAFTGTACIVWATGCGSAAPPLDPDIGSSVGEPPSKASASVTTVCSERLDAGPDQLGRVQLESAEPLPISGCSLLESLAGQAVASQTLDRDLRVLWERLPLEDVTALQQEEDGLPVLRFVLELAPRVTELKLVGVPAAERKLLAGVAPTVPVRLNRAARFALRSDLQQALQDRGYARAAVEESSLDGGVLGFLVTPGPQLFIHENAFSGVEPELARALEDVVRGGVYEPVSEPQLDRDHLLVVAALYDRGYLENRVEPPELEQIHDNGVRVLHAVSLGPVYRFGTVGLEGDLSPAERQELSALLGFHRGEVFQRSAVMDAVSAIEAKMVAMRGHGTVSIRTELDDTRYEADVVLEIGWTGEPL